MNNIFDTHDEKPTVPLTVDNIGITRLMLKPLHFRGYWLIPTLSAFIELSKRRRGAHISRITRLVHQILNNTSFGYDVIDSLAIKLLETHEEVGRSRVVFKARVAGSESNLSIRYEASAERGGLEKRVSEARITLINACPCALTVSRAISGEPYTHMQKTRVRVVVETKNLIDPLDIGLTLEGVFPITKNILTRLEEYKVIAEVYEKPLFNEDISRLTIKLIYEKFRKVLADNDRIIVSALSYETIHTYRIYSCLFRKISELDDEFASSRS